MPPKKRRRAATSDNPTGDNPAGDDQAPVDQAGRSQRRRLEVAPVSAPSNAGPRTAPKRKSRFDRVVEISRLLPDIVWLLMSYEVDWRLILIMPKRSIVAALAVDLTDNETQQLFTRASRWLNGRGIHVTPKAIVTSDFSCTNHRHPYHSSIDIYRRGVPHPTCGKHDLLGRSLAPGVAGDLPCTCTHTNTPASSSSSSSSSSAVKSDTVALSPKKCWTRKYAMVVRASAGSDDMYILETTDIDLHAINLDTCGPSPKLKWQYATDDLKSTLGQVPFGLWPPSTKDSTVMYHLIGSEWTLMAFKLYQNFLQRTEVVITLVNLRHAVISWAIVEPESKWLANDWRHMSWEPVNAIQSVVRGPNGMYAIIWPSDNRLQLFTLSPMDGNGPATPISQLRTVASWPLPPSYQPCGCHMDATGQFVTVLLKWYKWDSDSIMGGDYNDFDDIAGSSKTALITLRLLTDALFKDDSKAISYLKYTIDHKQGLPPKAVRVMPDEVWESAAQFHGASDATGHSAFSVVTVVELVHPFHDRLLMTSLPDGDFMLYEHSSLLRTSNSNNNSNSNRNHLFSFWTVASDGTPAPTRPTMSTPAFLGGTFLP